MSWNWQLSDWPEFKFNPDLSLEYEKPFLLGAGSSGAYLKGIGVEEYNQFAVEILSEEGLESSRIEGEWLDRESLQSSIRRHFGLNTAQKKVPAKESGMAELICNIYESYDKPLTHEMLGQWHAQIFDGSSGLEDLGRYRSHPEPMQIVSNRYDAPQVYFEAPPSAQVPHEMEAFIKWFNGSRRKGSILARAAIAHVYFESIHPFEDGNGRIGRALVEKILSQGVGKPILIAVSKVLEKRKKEYYAALERCNRSLQVDHWVEFFSQVILQAQEESMKLLAFLVGKAKMLTALKGQLNERQEKVLLRMFAEGPDGFKGGLSAENYLSISKTSRATATRDLADLVQKGALTKTGELRHTRYALNIIGC